VRCTFECNAAIAATNVIAALQLQNNNYSITLVTFEAAELHNICKKNVMYRETKVQSTVIFTALTQT